MGELYQDTKGPGKLYLAAVAACQGRRDCTISLESTQAFEDSISATMDKLRNHSIEPEEMLACCITFELLPNYVKQALKNSWWWVDVLTAKNGGEYTIQDTYPAPQPLHWKHLIDTLVASFFPSQVQPNKYLKMWWGVPQECAEPFAAFLPRVERTGHNGLRTQCRDVDQRKPRHF